MRREEPDRRRVPTRPSGPAVTGSVVDHRCRPEFRRAAVRAKLVKRTVRPHVEKSRFGIRVGSWSLPDRRRGLGPDYAIILPVRSTAQLRGAAPLPSMTLQFLENNWSLLLVMLVTGAMLVWPFIKGRVSAAREIGALEATALINRRNAVLVDVREAKEYEGARIPNAVHVPHSQLASRGQELKKFTARPVIAYCERGPHSRAAVGALGKIGFGEVYTLRGGLRAWSEAGLPVEKGG
jgi:rhodanese-related sulfurtransferase